MKMLDLIGQENITELTIIKKEKMKMSKKYF